VKINIPLIRHETWNSLVRDISRRRPLRFDPIPKPRMWSHPWKITPYWDGGNEAEGTKGQWLFRIRPGFVNGLEVTAPTRVKHAGERTIARLKEAMEDIKSPDRKVDAFLTEWPSIEVGETRTIGTGAEPTGLVGSALTNVKITYEPVPKFFTNLGVTEAHIEFEGNIFSGATFKDGIEDTKSARRLRSCDVSLWKDRPSAKFEVYEGSILDGSFGAIYITYNHSGGMKKNPYLRISEKYVPPIEPESDMALLEGITDPEFDVLKIASIYFVSPPGIEAGAPLDETWTPYVEYKHFWNLAHSPQTIPDSVPIEPIRFVTPILGGIVNPIIAFLLAPLNSQLNQALQILKSRNLKGAFWSL
jgi:hypothetical protein